MKKINILQLVTGLGMGGAEKVVYDLAFNSDKSKFNTYVIALSKRVERVQEFIDGKLILQFYIKIILYQIYLV